MDGFFHNFGLHGTEITMAVIAVIIFVFLGLSSKDFRTFVVLGSFSFATKIGQLAALFFLKTFAFLGRMIKIIFLFQWDTFQRLFTAIAEEQEDRSQE